MGILKNSGPENIKNDIKDKEIREAEECLFSEDDLAPIKPKRFQEKEAGLGLREAIAKKKKDDTERCSGDYSDNGGGDTKRVTFTFHPKRLMKGVFVLLFLFLAVSFFYNPFYAYFPWNKGIEGNIVANAVEQGINAEEKLEEKTAKIGQATEEKAATEEETKEETKTAEEKEESTKKKEIGTESGSTTYEEDNKEKTETAEGVSLIIDKIKTEKKDWGGKVSEVSFTIENTLRTFTPKVKAYAYDSKTQNEYKKAPVIQKFDPLERGKRLKGKIVFSRQFADTTTEKTVLLQLYDEGNEAGYAQDEKLAEIVKKVQIK